MSDEASHESAEHWGGAAEAWARAAEEEETGASARATRWMLEAAALRPGDEVLELACGAGRVGLQVAEMVQPGGAVLCSDFSEGMVEAVRERVSRRGVENVEARVLDAEDLSLDSERFDVALCRFGYMLMRDPAAALAETRRVLRPGGRLVLAVWGEAGRNPWLATVMGAVIDQLGAPPPEPGTPGPFALGDAARLEQMLKAAGFVDADVVDIETEQSYDSLEGWWQELYDVGGPLAALLDALPSAQAEAIKDASLAAAQPYAGSDGGVVFPASILGARAQRPDRA